MWNKRDPKRRGKACIFIAVQQHTPINKLEFLVRLHHFGVFILLLINIISLQLPVDKAMYSKNYLELRKLVTSEDQLQSLIT